MYFVGKGQHKLPDANNDFVSLLVYSIINKTCRTCTMLSGNQLASNRSINHWSIGHSTIPILYYIIYFVQKNNQNVYMYSTLSHVPYDANRVLRFLTMKSVWHTHSHTHMFFEDKTNERTKK